MGSVLVYNFAHTFIYYHHHCNPLHPLPPLISFHSMRNLGASHGGSQEERADRKAYGPEAHSSVASTLGGSPSASRKTSGATPSAFLTQDVSFDSAFGRPAAPGPAYFGASNPMLARRAASSRVGAVFGAAGPSPLSGGGGAGAQPPRTPSAPVGSGAAAAMAAQSVTHLHASQAAGGATPDDPTPPSSSSSAAAGVGAASSAGASESMRNLLGPQGGAGGRTTGPLMPVAPARPR